MTRYYILPLILMALPFELRAQAPGDPESRRPSNAIGFNDRPKKPFKRAMVVSGAGLNFTIFLGQLEAAREAGQEPDVILGSCGGALPAVLANRFKTTQERLDYVKSPGFHQFLRDFQYQNNGIGTSAWRLGKYAFRRAVLARIPEVSTEYIGKPGETDDPTLKVPFKSEGIRAILTVAKLNFSPALEGRLMSGRKIWTEGLVSDDETAKILRNFHQGIVPATIRGSAITPFSGVVVTGMTLFEANLASSADPGAVPPREHRGERYMALNTYPLEIGHRIADRLIMSFHEEYDLIEQTIAGGAFQYNNNSRLKAVNEKFAHVWMDSSDKLAYLNQHGNMNPAPSGTVLMLRVPEDLEAYRKIIDAQYEYGLEKGREAFDQIMVNEKRHIKSMNADNSTIAMRVYHGRFEYGPEFTQAGIGAGLAVSGYVGFRRSRRIQGPIKRGISKCAAALGAGIGAYNMAMGGGSAAWAWYLGGASDLQEQQENGIRMSPTVIGPIQELYKERADEYIRDITSGMRRSSFVEKYGQGPAERAVFQNTVEQLDRWARFQAR